MAESYHFRPPRRLGLVYHLAAVLLLTGAGFLGLLQASRAAIEPVFLLFVLPAILALFIGPVLLYNAYALWGASYNLERDGIHLQWGLRSEDIPMNEVLWVRSESSFRDNLPVPWMRLPGNVTGRRTLRDGTPIEFFASRVRPLLLIATSTRLYAISPAHPNEFLEAFKNLSELGTLTPVPARSVFPTILLSRLGHDAKGLALLVTGLALGLILLVWVGLSVRTRDFITWQSPSSQPAEPVPAVRLFLLPVLDALFFTTDTLLGLFFYRRIETQIASYLLWGVSVLTAILFLGAVFFILRV